MEKFNWELFEQDQIDFDNELERAAFENTFLILTGKATLSALLKRQDDDDILTSPFISYPMSLLFDPFTKDYSPKFPHLHNEVDRNELIDTMIEYYVETEEYEKCAALIKIKT
jgi:hypothetical protein